MRCLATVLSAALVAVAPAATLAQSGVPVSQADLCTELLAYVEKAAADQAKEQSGQAQAPGGAPAPRGDSPGSGTQGGGSVSGSASNNTQGQQTAPTTAPATPGAASEPASSPHASDSGDQSGKSAPSLELLRTTAQAGDRPACRQAVIESRRGGAALPAALIALAAYESDPSKR